MQLSYFKNINVIIVIVYIMFSAPSLILIKWLKQHVKRVTVCFSIFHAYSAILIARVQTCLSSVF